MINIIILKYNKLLSLFTKYLMVWGYSGYPCQIPRGSLNLEEYVHQHVYKWRFVGCFTIYVCNSDNIQPRMLLYGWKENRWTLNKHIDMTNRVASGLGSLENHVGNGFNIVNNNYYYFVHSFIFNTVFH